MNLETATSPVVHAVAKVFDTAFRKRVKSADTRYAHPPAIVFPADPGTSSASSNRHGKATAGMHLSLWDHAANNHFSNKLDWIRVIQTLPGRIGLHAYRQVSPFGLSH